MDKDSPDFNNCETLIDLGFSGLVFYWKPQTMINLLEFIQQNAGKAKAKQQSDGYKQIDVDLKQQIYEEVDASTDAGGQIDNTQWLQPEPVKPIKSNKSSKDKIAYAIKVNVKLAYLKAIFIHPENNTYPIFSIIV